LRFEKTDETSIRLLMFGLIESIHLTLNHLTEGRTEAYATALATIDYWKRKNSEFSNNSTDPLVSLFSRAFESMVGIVRNVERCHMLRSLGSLELERSHCLQFED
ncbi:hypothetical protein PMAYCL1PPCAC_13946, partial [Pristionchus mayeri]